MNVRDSNVSSSIEHSTAKYRKKIENLYIKQKKTVLQHLNKCKIAQSMREIEASTQVPIYNLCRIIAEFQKRKIVEVKYDAVSRLSGHPNVHHYGLVADLNVKDGL